MATFAIRGSAPYWPNPWFLILTSFSLPDRPDVKIKNHGLGQYGAEPHYSVRYHFGNFVH